jgi:hypothetical protein
MIVTNMPYSWALMRKIFNLRSFFGDSTAGHIQAGQPRELNGYSTGAVQLDSRPRSRQTSKADGDPGKFSWHKLNLQHSKEDHDQSWPTTPEKEIRVEATTASSSSSAGSVPKPAPAATTAWTLDRLYPLDDDELVATDHTQRRYEGV